MPQPTEYQPETTFWSFEMTQSWFPGHQLDAEFANLDITLTEILANLALIQRDDGAVANKTIGFDQLTDDVRDVINSLTATNVQTIVDILSTKSPINSPIFTGDPKAPTPAPGDNDTSIATTAFVTAAAAVVTAAFQAADATKQPLDADLTALAALASTGLVARTAADTYALRTIAGTVNQTSVTNGDGVAGNPTVALAPVAAGALNASLHANAGGLM